MTAPRFTLSLARDADGQVQIIASGAGRTVQVMGGEIPVLSSPDPSAGTAATWDDARLIGGALFRSAHPSEIEALLEESRYRAGEQPLAISLELGDAELAALPWELLYDPRLERFLVLATGSTIARSWSAPTDTTEQPAPETGNLRVQLLSSAIDEASLAFAQTVGADPRVDVSTRSSGLALRRRNHVVVLNNANLSIDLIPLRTPFAVIRGDLAQGRAALRRTQSVLILPAATSDSEVAHLLRTLFARLAAGDTVEAALVAARRAVASNEAARPIDWAGPILLSGGETGPLVAPGAIGAALGKRVVATTVSWANDALAGIVTSLILFLVGLVLFRLGFSSSASFELDIFSPVSLYQSFTTLMLELATYQQSILLIAAALFALATALVGTLWWRNRVIDPEEVSGFAARFTGPLSRLRTVTFLAVATLTVLGSYGYQQYLWRVKLPIPDGAFGVAITRAAEPSDLADRLGTSLGETIGGRELIVRELPLEYDAGDIDDARSLGRQLGASVVLIDGSEGGDDENGHVAYLVFTDPRPGRTVLSRGATAFTSEQPVPATVVTRIQEDLAVPVARGSSTEALAAFAAGVIDYTTGDIPSAIDHLQRVSSSPGESALPNGTLAFLLGNAYLLDENSRAAEDQYRAAVSAFEAAADADDLSPGDELTLVAAYLALGNLARDAGDWPGVIAWLQQAVTHRDSLVAKAPNLDRPSDLNDVFARVYSLLAAANRASGDSEDELFWSNRARDELAILTENMPDGDRGRWVQLSATRLVTGDCVGAVEAVNQALTLAPGDPDALLNAAAIAYVQSDRGAADHLQGISADDPLAVRAHDELGLLLARGAVDPDGGYADPTLLAAAQATMAAVASPSALGLQELGAVAAWQGILSLTDQTALFSGDLLTAAKSSVEWSADPIRRQAAITAYSTAIDSLAELSRRRPDDPSVTAALASVYAARMTALAAGRSDPTGSGNEVAADATMVVTLADRILADGSGAARRDRLAAWALKLEALNEIVRLSLTTSIAEPLTQLDLAIVRAQAAVETNVPLDDAETAAIRAIYDEVYRYATEIALDPTLASNATANRAAVFRPDLAEQALLRTVCREEREYLAGQTLLDAGDTFGAQTRFNTALAANPRYAPALIGLTLALLDQGSIPDAITRATAATEAAPDRPDIWLTLTHVMISAGDTADPARRDAALTRYLELAAPMPDQQRTATLRDAIALFAGLLDDDPTRSPTIRAMLPALQSALDAIPDDGAYQLAARYAELGRLAALADAAPEAEPLLRRSLDLDPHQPLTLTDLAMVEISTGADPTATIQTLIAEIGAPVWRATAFGPLALLAQVQTQIEHYTARFPDRAASLTPLTNALASVEAAESLPDDVIVEQPTADASPEAEQAPVATPASTTDYTSEQFGFSITMPYGWAIYQTISEPGTDFLVMYNGFSIVQMVVYEDPEATLADCLQTRRRDLANDATVSNFRQMTDPAGNEVGGETDDLVYGVYRYTVTDSAGAGEWTKYASCQTYPRPGTILLFEQFTDPADYALQVLAREILLRALVLPEPLPGTASPVASGDS